MTLIFALLTLLSVPVQVPFPAASHCRGSEIRCRYGQVPMCLCDRYGRNCQWACVKER